MKISEILQLAIDKEYWLADKSKYGSAARTFMCIVVDDMNCMGLITHEELFAVIGYIEQILGEDHILTEHLIKIKGVSYSESQSADVRLNFWNQIIKELQAKGE